MKILFDQGAPVPLRRYFHQYSVKTAAERGWAALENGDLLAMAESTGFDLSVTTDQNLRYQQNLSHRTIGIIVLKTTSWPRIERKIDAVTEAIRMLPAGGYVEVPF